MTSNKRSRASRWTEAFLGCAQCDKRAVHPRLLSCGHVICTACVSSAEQASSDVFSELQCFISCRRCNQRTLLNLVLGGELPLACFHERVSAVEAYCEQGKKMPCVGCSEVASFYCESGCGYLCSDCQDKHSLFGMHPPHKVASINELIEKEFSVMLKYCPKHNECKIEWACACCPLNPFKCSLCLETEETEGEVHSNSPLKEAVDGHVEELWRSISHARLKLIEISQLKKPVEKYILSIEDAFRMQIKRVQQHFDVLRKQLEDMEEAVKREVRKLCDSILEENRNDVSILKAFESNIKSSVTVGQEAYALYQQYGSPLMISPAIDVIQSALRSFNPKEPADRPKYTLTANFPETVSVSANTELSQSRNGVNWIRVHEQPNIMRDVTTINKEIRSVSILNEHATICAPNPTGNINSASPIGGFAINPVNGDLFLTDVHKGLIHIFSPDLEHISTFGEYGEESGHLINPLSVAVSHDLRIGVVDFGNKRVQIYDSSMLSANTLRHGHKDGKPQFKIPQLITFDSVGNSFITDSELVSIHKWSPHREPVCSFGVKKGSPICGLMVNQSNELVTLRYGSDLVECFSNDGDWICDIPIQKVRDSAFLSPSSEGGFVVTDSGNNRILFYTKDGQVINSLVIQTPIGAIFGPSGTLYVVASNPPRIIMY